MINKIRAVRFLAAAFTLFAAPLYAGEAASKEGKTEFGFYMEFSYFNDRGQAWTGSEATFTTRLKARSRRRSEYKHRPPCEHGSALKRERERS